MKSLETRALELKIAIVHNKKIRSKPNLRDAMEQTQYVNETQTHLSYFK